MQQSLTRDKTNQMQACHERLDEVDVLNEKSKTLAVYDSGKIVYSDSLHGLYVQL